MDNELEKPTYWTVTGFYNDTVTFSRQHETKALRVDCKDELTRDMEVSVFKNRSDIGTIIIEEKFTPWPHRDRRLY